MMEEHGWTFSQRARNDILERARIINRDRREGKGAADAAGSRARKKEEFLPPSPARLAIDLAGDGPKGEDKKTAGGQTKPGEQ